MAEPTLTPEQQAELNKLLEAEKPREIEVKLETGQVYKGKTEAEVIQQLVKAQESASKALTQQKAELEAARLKAQQPEKPAAKPSGDGKFNQEEYYRLFQTDPVAAQDYLFEAQFGVTAQQFKEDFSQVRKETDYNRQQREILLFRAKHPEYTDSKEDAALIMGRIAEMGFDPDNEFIPAKVFDAALWSLQGDGQIKTKVAGEQVQAAQAPPQLPASGTQHEPVMDDKLNKMSSKELEEFMRNAGVLR